MLAVPLLIAGGGSSALFLEDVMGLPINNVESYGAVHDGSTDDSTAIQAAIDALPACGGIVYFPCGDYAIGTTIDVGDGTNSTGSTRNGVHLMGAGIASPYSSFGWTGLSTVNGTKFLWIGGNDPMVRINGPLAGWGMTDISLHDPSETASDGLKVVSGVHGYVARVGTLGVGNGFRLTTIVPTGGLVGQAVGTFHNRFEQIVAQMPGSFAFQTGLYLDAGSSAQGVFVNTFDQLFISYTNQTTNTAEAIRLDGCDGNNFREGHIAGFPGANNYLVSFIYGTKPDWPADNTLSGFSFGTTASGAFYNANTPVGSNPNRIIDIRYGDGRPSNPSLANLDWGFSNSSP